MHGANIRDRDGAKGVLKRSRSRFPFVELAYVDGGYAGRLVRWAKDRTHIVLEVVKRSAEQGTPPPWAALRGEELTSNCAYGHP